MQTPQSDYSRPTNRRRGMRTGYTTGACAAAAAKAATLGLLSGNAVDEVSIHLPMGREATFKIHAFEKRENSVMCSVVKDGGDDPDVTHGAEVWATVWRASAEERGVAIRGGVGVGVVTLPGLDTPPGQPAINRVPRRMIVQSVEDAAKEQGAECGFVVEISVPAGVELAKKTENARLGIIGGLSILGTTGVVQPFSTAAWRASVHVAIDVAAANANDHVVISTGSQSERFARRVLDLPDTGYIDAGIFTGPALKRCVLRQIRRVTVVGMVGKFSKIAMGKMVTHVAGNRVDPAFLADLAAACGASETLQAQVRHVNSARHFQELALENGLLAVFTLMCEKACEQCRRHLEESADRVVIDCLCFDFEGAILGSASTSARGLPLPFGGRVKGSPPSARPASGIGGADGL